ncbi:MAG: phosphopantetheine-binding protein [Beijerinckiaceae bacterium]|nr:phosphopantetheine-binding protein [Beijerinckiaceae bacterium]MCI0736057.1 phosphopantetheine-binding protein [Beijerinckiaceae bacterium]
MNRDIIHQLKVIIIDDLGIDATVDNLDEKRSLFEDGLGLNSLAIVDFIALIESRFGFQFSEDDLNLETFSNLTVLANIVSKRIEHVDTN